MVVSLGYNWELGCVIDYRRGTTVISNGLMVVELEVEPGLLEHYDG